MSTRNEVDKWLKRHSATPRARFACPDVSYDLEVWCLADGEEIIIAVHGPDNLQVFRRDSTTELDISLDSVTTGN